jgi:hypothetical protein
MRCDHSVMAEFEIEARAEGDTDITGRVLHRERHLEA